MPEAGGNKGALVAGATGTEKMWEACIESSLGEFSCCIPHSPEWTLPSTNHCGEGQVLQGQPLAESFRTVSSTVVLLSGECVKVQL